MRLKEFDHLNLSLLSKQAWRLIQNPGSPWASTFLKLYFSKCSFWDVKKKNGDSWVWSSILRAMDILKKEARWVVGNGKTIDVRNDNWLASGAPIKLKDNSFSGKVVECIDQVNGC